MSDDRDEVKVNGITPYAIEYRFATPPIDASPDWRSFSPRDLSAEVHGEVTLDLETHERLIEDFGLDRLVTIKMTHTRYERRKGWRGWIDRARRQRPVVVTWDVTIPHVRLSADALVIAGGVAAST